ncbi:MAG: alpha/beta fold hydrolase [Rhodobacteraceae bacterium]|nr:alpha/beta fold hydrolase [Paracoccaceae bacterium]
MANWTDAATMASVDDGAGDAIPCHISEPGGELRGLVLLIHGRNGAAAQPQIDEIARAYLARGWQVAAPDLPASLVLPGSDAPQDPTMTDHLDSARRVLNWLRSLRQSPRFALAGHSLGAYAGAMLAGDAGDLHHLLAVSPALSGRALLAARRAMGPAAIADLESEAPRMRAEMEACDAGPALARLDAPVAVLTGAPDGLTPPRFARAYFASAAEGRFYATIPGQHHCPTGPVTARLLEAALDAVEA